MSSISANVDLVGLRLPETAVDSRDARCDEVHRYFAQQVLRQGARTTLGETLKRDKVLRGAAHVVLFLQGEKCGRYAAVLIAGGLAT